MNPFRYFFPNDLAAVTFISGDQETQERNPVLYYVMGISKTLQIIILCIFYTLDLYLFSERTP